MDKLKQWVALTVVGVLGIGAAGWFLLISPKRSDASDLRLQADAKAASNSQLQSQIKMLKAQAKDLPKQQARLAAVAAKIPDNPALPALIRALTAAADDAGVELVSLAPGAPTAVAAATPAAATPVRSTGAGVPVATGSTAATSATARPSAAAAGAGSLQSIGLAINVVGGYFQVEQFLDRVENLSRALKVTGFNLAPGSNPVKPVATGTTASAPTDPGKTLSAAITGNVYLATGRVVAPVTVPGK